MKSNKKLLIILALIIIQLTCITSVSSLGSGADSIIISVPDDFPSINAAINAASEYCTIIVKEGIYEENPTINKALTIVAEGNVTVVGEGGVERGAKAVFTINSDSVVLSGFNIRSKGYQNSTYYASGINLNGDKIKISGNTIKGTYYGIFCFIQSHCNITANTITNTKKDAIRIIGGSDNIIDGNIITGNAQSGIAISGYSDIITENTIANNTRGLGLGAAYSLVYGNILANNSESGIFLASSNSTIAYNTINLNEYAVYVTSFFAAPNNNTFYGNNFVANAQLLGADSVGNNQIWDSTLLRRGNYWSSYDWGDADGDGIGDVPYVLNIGNVDNYPLLNQTGTSSISPSLPIAPLAINGQAGLWHFNEVESNGVTPDSLGINPVMLEPSGNWYTPVLVEGKYGKALRFNGTDYAYMLASSSLNVVREITIEAWVYVNEYKTVGYNNIVVECERTPDKYPNRIMGFAFTGEAPQNNSSPLQGSLRGFMLGSDGVFNEIVTSEAVISLNQWTHVIFIRSLTTGMHIYVNDIEQAVMVTSGSQNPAGEIARGSEFYIGHDSICAIDELSISSIAIVPTTSSSPTESATLTMAPIWTEWWFIAALAVLILIFGLLFLYLRRYSPKTKP